MARKANTPNTTTSRSSSRSSTAPAVAQRTTSTPVRNSAIPKVEPAAAQKVVTYEMIAKRAYEISQSPERGSDFDNWIRAERELKGL
ncbi:MAG TPA: DUF2934 domain-containing protein [Tepidisphaeraceae bacterium]|nr:DUF2934 domain-containing protein [Tepidisphaeraceae bacterium]